MPCGWLYGVHIFIRMQCPIARPWCLPKRLATDWRPLYLRYASHVFLCREREHGMSRWHSLTAQNTAYSPFLSQSLAMRIMCVCVSVQKRLTIFLVFFLLLIIQQGYIDAKCAHWAIARKRTTKKETRERERERERERREQASKQASTIPQRLSTGGLFIPAGQYHCMTPSHAANEFLAKLFSYRKLFSLSYTYVFYFQEICLPLPSLVVSFYTLLSWCHLY